MTWSLRSGIFVVALATQMTPLSVPAIGEPDVLSGLHEPDILAITARAHETCDPLWLIKAFRSQLANSRFVEAYCMADASRQGDVFLRRGHWVAVIDRSAQGWAISGKGQYAQVSADARTPAQVPGDRDIRRPFRVSGPFTDAELVSLVTFIRSSPPNPDASAPHDPRVEGNQPIGGVWRNADGTVRVSVARSDFESQVVELRETDRGWEILRITFVVA
jgi:hypothetical protein